MLRKEGKESLQSKKVQAIMRKKMRIEQKAYLLLKLGLAISTVESFTQLPYNRVKWVKG